jgi:RHS repeat-associated protein
MAIFQPSRREVLLLEFFAVLAGIIILVLSLACSGHTSEISRSDHSGKGDDAQGIEWRFKYDTNGRPEEVVDPAGRVTRYRYDDDERGDIKSVHKHLPGGQSITWDYDRFGRLTSAADPLGKTLFRYDKFGRLATVERDGSPRVAYESDSLGRVTKVQVDESLWAQYRHDFAGRLKSIKTPVGQIDYEYWLPKGYITRTLPNGVKSRFEYFPDGKLERIVHTNKENYILASFTYSYRPDGLVATADERFPRERKVIEYEYDKTGRLSASRTTSGNTIRFEYDRLGNRTSVHFDQTSVNGVYDWAARILEYGGDKFEHDAVGNVVKRVMKDGSTIVFGYDADGHLTSVNKQSQTVSYRYDADGKLVERSVDGKTTRFVPRPFSETWEPLAEVGPDGVRRLYIWDSRLLGIATPDGAEFILEDGLGSARLLVDSQGTVAEIRSYRPFGLPETLGKTTGLTPGFAGLFFDPFAEIYLTTARSYDPELGRFLQRDPSHTVPVGSQHAMTAYVYCGNDPVNFVDRNGRRSTANALDSYSDRLVRHGRPGAAPLERSAESRDGENDSKASEPQAGRGERRLLPEGRKDADSQEAMLLRALLQGIRIADLLDYCRRNEETSLCTIDIDKIREALLEKKRRKHTRRWVAPYWVRTYEPLWWTYEPYVYYWRSYPSYYSYSLGSYHSSSSRYYSSVSRTYSYAYRYGASFRYAGNVGGVWLSGANKAVEALGNLKGVALDEANGRLVLFGEDKSTSVGLSALRLDDVVAIFKSVYDHGVGPWVSIEDDPKNPNGPCVPMYGPEMAGTFAGWVLYEADRVMKNYGAGADNITRKKINSGIKGYNELLDARFRSPEWAAAKGGGGWQRVGATRFWITPSEVVRRTTGKDDLTLLEVPLQLNVDPPKLMTGGKSGGSVKAHRKKDLAYAAWFTNHYDDLAKEWASSPLEGPDRGKKFHVFAELKRIALLAAIAERLRDQGVPLPTWMRNHRMNHYPTPTTDPRYYNVRVIGNEQRAMGGVGLSPIYNPSSEKNLIKTVRDDEEATAMAKVAFSSLPQEPKPKAIEFVQAGKNFTAAVLPGRTSKEIGPLKISRADLAVPLYGEENLTLTRHYSSFLRPDGELGICWTLDLPHLLLDARRPAAIEGKRLTLKPQYLLTTPMGKVNVTFSEKRTVPELKGVFLVPRKSDDILALSGAPEPKTGVGEFKVTFRDGRKWYFDKNGYLCATSEDGITVVYRRDNRDRIGSIEGWHGEKPVAKIRLQYDEKDRVTRATAGKDNFVEYSYDEQGRLTKVRTSVGVETYDYEQSLLVSMDRDGEKRRFVYDKDGRLTKETDDAGNTVAVYQMAADSNGSRLVRQDWLPDGSRGITEVLYDRSFRPIAESYPDGIKVSFSYRKDGSVVETDTSPDGSVYQITRRTDGKDRVTVKLPEGGVQALTQEDGRVVITEGDKRIGSAYKASDGSLDRLELENTAFRWHRDKTGVIEELKINESGDQPSRQDWITFKLDREGRAVSVEDSTHANIKVSYGPTGTPDAVKTTRGSLTVERTAAGEVRKASTSWGVSQANEYDPKSGMLKEMEIVGQGGSAGAKFGPDGITEIRYFDGGTARRQYHEANTRAKAKPKKIMTEDGLEIDYEYDPMGRLISARSGNQYTLRIRYDDAGRVTSLVTARVP